ncbi:growth hormone-inducible transmembrane protein-like [Watersipora subatra]|uniref:growth hormone-inducible transmembrane protein-like n=1 Tax=Watersipora subatra TaxID=2589382 RepID=UPI00355BFDDA
MLAARFCSLSSSSARQTVFRIQSAPLKTNFTTTSNACNTGRAARVAGRMGAKQTTLKEKLMAPVGNNPFGIGRGVVAGCAAFGVGALCVYGSGMSGSVGVREKSMMWPQYIKDRVKTTYLYFAGSLGITAATAIGVFRTPALLRIVSYQGMLGMLVSLAAMYGSSMVCHSIPYTESFGSKHLAWMVHCGVVGAVLAPLCILGGPLLTRAALYTSGIVGGLSAIAVCAPSEKFLNWGAPLGMGFGLVFVSSLAGMWLPPTTALGAGLYSISVYGGLALFSGLMLYNTQKVMKRAELTPYNSQMPFDPINNCMGIYMDAINIFIRVAMIMAGGGNRKK